MKKLAFTALAVVAFSGISMANSLSKTINNTPKMKSVYYRDCNVWAINFCEEMDGWNDTDSTSAYAVYRQVVAFCESRPAEKVDFLPVDDNFIGAEGGKFEAIQP